MIWIYHKGLWLELVTPMGKSPDDSIKPLVISEVVEFRATQLLTKIGQGPFGLGKHYPNVSTSSITSNFKKQLKVWKSQDSNQAQIAIDCFKGSLSGLCPFKTFLLHALDLGSHDTAKAYDESSIEWGQAMEALHFRDRGKHGPTLNGFYFSLNHLYALSWDNVVKKNKLRWE